MSLNMTYVLRNLKRRMGASHFPLPISDDEIVEIIKEDTLSTFSSYFPYTTNIKVNPKLDEVENEPYFFYLHDDNIEEILGVVKVYINSIPYTSYSSEDYIFNTGGTDFLTMQTTTDLISAVEIPRTFNFTPPNILELFPKSRIICEDFIVKIKCVHPSHLGTIHLNLKEDFLKLALYDVQYAIFQILKHYDGIGTAVGNISLKIEEFEAAEANKKELLESWEHQYYKESNRKKIWVV